MSEQSLNREHLEEMLRTIANNQELLEATMRPLAQLLNTKYVALIEAGFTMEQALEIIKFRGLNV
jgi:uncharacterized protein YjgD (DUF1641 family)